MMKTIEFSRAVHAEVAAILNAGLHGISVKGCALFTTTFPCHDCARHIVASGIKRVTYIEPYPKSLAVEFHEDSIAVDQTEEAQDKVNFKPFVGIAPRRYIDFFDMGRVKRKKDDGTIMDGDSLKSSALPKLVEIPPIYLVNEPSALTEIKRVCRDKHLL